MLRVIISYLILLFSINAHANIGEDFGYGPRSASLAGASTTWNFDGYAAYNNPAGLPLFNQSGTGFSEERFTFSYGIIYMNPSFTPINNVVTSNSYSSGSQSSPTIGTIDTSYKSTFGQMFGASWHANPDFFNLTVGLTLFFPFEQLAYIDSGQTLQPEYVLYRDRTQQPDIAFAAGADLTPWLHFGLGMHVDYTITTQANANLLQSTSGTSTAQFATAVTPKITPYFGFLLNNGEEESLGVVFRLPSSVTSNVSTNSNFQATGAAPAVPFAFLGSNTVIYQPFSVEVGGMLKTSDATRSFVQVDYQAWSHFQAPYLLIANPQVQGCGTTCGLLISGGPTLDAQYRDIVIPRVGEEISFGKTTLRLGYAYRQSIFKTTSSGIGNYLDPSKHMLNAGMGFVFDRFLGYNKPWNLDFSVNYQALVTQQVTKSAGDETGSTTVPSTTTPTAKIGSPGYQAGGHLIGGQVALTVGL